MSAVLTQRQIVESLGYPFVETHISYVVLTGRHAYKIKKAVGFTFLDFRTLAARRFYCEEELRLNRRFAPELYLDVVPVTGPAQAPSFGGNGQVLEYAVKMRQFDQEQLLTRLLERGLLTEGHVDRAAAAVAAFHQGAARVASGASFGTPVVILDAALQNFSQLLDMVRNPADRRDLEEMRAWTSSEHEKLTPLMASRHEAFVRECHGDLHLNNIALVEGRVTLFDCIEFNESMRWIDVLNDVAFLVMDLQERHRPDLAARFLNAYLEHTGDYPGVALVPFYVAYRAMVRAKIATLRLGQLATLAERDAVEQECRQYLDLARRHGEGHPAIVVMHGLSGSGKTTVAQSMLEHTGAIRVRTDVERKRLHGWPPTEHSHSAVGHGLYTESATREVYEHVSQAVRHIAAAGYVAIADGAFLVRWQRNLLRLVAARLNVPFFIVSCSAPVPTLKERIARRLESSNDVSEATMSVLESQLVAQEPLTSDEQQFVIPGDEAATLARLPDRERVSDSPESMRRGRPGFRSAS